MKKDCKTLIICEIDHRDVCETEIEEKPSIIGGINEDGSPIVIEIGETIFFSHIPRFYTVREIAVYFMPFE